MFVIENRVFKFFSVKGLFVVQIVENAGEFLFFRPSRENPIFGKRLALSKTCVKDTITKVSWVSDMDDVLRNK